MDPIRTFGIVGLGKMGADLALNALHHGYGVAGMDTHAVSHDLTDKGLKVAADARQLVALLTPPRFVIVYVPAGPPVDAVLAELTGAMQPGDIIADGGNSYWGDSIRRYAHLKPSGIHFIDAGTSDGPGGALDGACFMVGGEDEPLAMIEPILRKLAVEGGYVRAGGPGAGHFVKLVHNGIEFAMLEAIGEGVDLLTRYRDDLPIDAILSCWRHGSVIRCWLIELMETMYREEGRLENIPSYVEDTGEVNWLVDHGSAHPGHCAIRRAAVGVARQPP
jgi:6-phosphogluconate dehydrogenase